MLLDALRSCGRDASSVYGILEVGKGVVDAVPMAVFDEEDTKLLVGDIAAADGNFWVAGYGDGDVVGCGEAVQLGLTVYAGSAHSDKDARGGRGYVPD